MGIKCCNCSMLSCYQCCLTLADGGYLIWFRDTPTLAGMTIVTQ
jgi:hypothetical protein